MTPEDQAEMWDGAYRQGLSDAADIVRDSAVQGLGLSSAEAAIRRAVADPDWIRDDH